MSNLGNIQFNIPYTTHQSLVNVQELIENPVLFSEEKYKKKCKQWFEDRFPTHTAFMTTSCTRAMELIALALNLQDGDEIILSPFNYVGVVNAFANYGVKPVFVDIDAATMNIDANQIEAAITKKTKAIIAMHYASIPCDLKTIRGICDKHQLILIEDGAHAMNVQYENKLLGSYGDFSCFSFDRLKNISSGEGGVLLCKKESKSKIEIAFNNGTNRSIFSKGLVNKYEWIAGGSKFEMSEYVAAVLFPLLEMSEYITNERIRKWTYLYEQIGRDEILQKYIPQVLLANKHNAHLAYLKFENQEQRDAVLKELNMQNIPVSFHYISLDNEYYRTKYQVKTICPVALEESNKLLRLPMHNYLIESEMDRMVKTLKEAVYCYAH